VLALLVGVSLILLTAYFGESANSPLHSVQRGIVAVLSPVQEGASKVLSPVRDVANWASGTLRAKSQRDQLEKTVQKDTEKIDQLESAKLQNEQLTKEVGLDQTIGAQNFDPVAADVIERDPSLWYQTVEVDRGSDEGVALNDPVIGDGALVGKVTTVDGSSSIVTLITDHSYAVTAQILNDRGDTGVLFPAVGNPNALLLEDLPNHATISVGDQVVTAGFSQGDLTSLYPPGIPIGQVSNADQNQLLNNGQVQVAPAADLRHVDSVQILTRPRAGAERAEAP
jgi:rod shape-determining protein MreC